MNEIGILGAGSWGTALAVHAVSAGCAVRLWARNPEIAAEIANERSNNRYLPDIKLPGEIAPTTQLTDLGDCQVLVVVVPSHGFRNVIRSLFAKLPSGGPVDLVSATKGIETETTQRMSEVATEEAATQGRRLHFSVLSGPTFAAELALGQPSAAVIASRSPDRAAWLSQLLATPRLRLYSTTDVVGVELGGAGKNVIAVGAGLVSGLGLGHNTLAALITRGLHELTRLGVASGGQRRTFSGLAGLGDLVLTCTGSLSRNRQTGIQLAAGKSLEEIQASTSMVAEGIRNSLSMTRLARKKGIEMPITEQMMGVMYEGKGPKQALEDLMTRELKAEAEL
jgi:glycerol-3-phosphate dehydrogenase (NAD(P)+)